MGGGTDVIDIRSAVQGEPTVVETSYGPVSVLVCGDRGKPACVTYHEVGVNSRTCFHGIIAASDPKRSALVGSFCFYHFDYPGCEVPRVVAGAPALSLDDAGRQVGEAMKILGIGQALGLGVGAGAYVLCRASLSFPSAFAGLALFSPCCRRPNWTEYAFGQAAVGCLALYGWRSRLVKGHIYQRLFSARISAHSAEYVSELLYTFDKEVEKIDPRAVRSYLSATVRRGDLRGDVKYKPGLGCQCLLFACLESIYKEESLELNFLLDPERSDYMEVFECGTLVTEEKPQETLAPLDQFVRLLQQRGLCR